MKKPTTREIETQKKKYLGRREQVNNLKSDDSKSGNGCGYYSFSTD
jgi:hypothetical protein